MPGKVAKAAHIFEKAEYEWYVEPPSVSAALFRVEPFAGLIVDPACGVGTIIDEARRAGFIAQGSDIVTRRRSSTIFGGIDFLRTTREGFAARHGSRHFNIVTNPPYFGGKGTEAFIKHARFLGAQKIAVFTEARFLFGTTRAKTLYEAMTPTKIYLLHPRPSCPPGTYLEDGHKAGGGTADFCWII